MALIAKLRDVEQQLLRTTQVVELHTKLAQGLLKCEQDDVTPTSEVLALMESVERAQTDLAVVTQHLVQIIKRRLKALGPAPDQRSLDGDETETEDELEEVELDPQDDEQIEEWGNGDNGLTDTTLENTGLEQSGAEHAGIEEPRRGGEFEAGHEHTTTNVVGETTDAARSSPACVLERYLAAASAVKESVTASGKEFPLTSGALENMNDPIVKNWAEAVKQNFKQAAFFFITRLSNQSITHELAASFCDASGLAVPIIASCKAKFSVAWILPAIEYYDTIYRLAGATSFVQTLLPMLECRNILVRSLDERVSKFLEETASNVASLTQKIKKRKQRVYWLSQYGEKLRNICQYCVIRHDVGDMIPWTAEQWGIVGDIGQHLSNLTKNAFKTQKMPGWVDKLRIALEKLEVTYPGRCPKPLYELCSAGDTRMIVAETDGQVIDSTPSTRNLNECDSEMKSPGLTVAPDNTHVDAVGAKRSREDVKAELPEAKRIAISTEVTNLHVSGAKLIFAEVKECLDMATQLKNGLEPGQLVVPFSRAGKDFRGLLHRVTKLSQHFRYIIRRDAEAEVAFAETIALQVQLICRCPCGFFGHAQLKGLLKPLFSIVKAAMKSPNSGTIAASYERLQAYWNEFHADQFQAMRNHIEATEREGKHLAPAQLRTPLRQLFVQFVDTCAVCLQELMHKTAPKRIEELRSKLLEIATVLNTWLEHVMGGGQLLHNSRKVLATLLRMNAKLPGSVPSVLVENVKKLLGQGEVQDPNESTNSVA